MRDDSSSVGIGPLLDQHSMAALKAMEQARDFPANTCAVSRHVALLAEAILRGEPCPQLADEPQYCAESMAWTVAELWRARTEIERLRAGPWIGKCQSCGHEHEAPNEQVKRPPSGGRA